MRVLLLASLLFPLLVVGQESLTDTTFRDNGSIRSINFYKLVPVDQLTKAERFQRGIMDGDLVADPTIRMRDSIVVFTPEGKPIYDVTEQVIELNRSRKPPSKEEIERREQRLSQAAKHLKFSGPLNIYDDLVRVWGKVGTAARDTITLGNSSDEPLHLKFNPRTDVIRVPQNVTIPAKGTIEVPVEVTLPLAEGQSGFEITDGGKVRKEIVVHYYTYHLDENDFATTRPSEPTLHLRSRPQMVLKLRSVEKLLKVYHGGQLVGNMPVGKLLDKFDIIPWPAGEYTLEVVDLVTMSKRYAVVSIRH